MGVIQRGGNSCLHSPSLWSPLKAGPKCYFPTFPTPRGTWVLAFSAHLSRHTAQSHPEVDSKEAASPLVPPELSLGETENRYLPRGLSHPREGLRGRQQPRWPAGGMRQRTAATEPVDSPGGGVALLLPTFCIQTWSTSSPWNQGSAPRGAPG